MLSTNASFFKTHIHTGIFYKLLVYTRYILAWFLERYTSTHRRLNNLGIITFAQDPAYPPNTAAQHWRHNASIESRGRI